MLLERIKMCTAYAEENGMPTSEIVLWCMLVYLDEINGNPEGGLLTSTEQLQLLTGLSKASVIRARNGLLEKGLIHTVSKKMPGLAVYTFEDISKSAYCETDVNQAETPCNHAQSDCNEVKSACNHVKSGCNPDSREDEKHEDSGIFDGSEIAMQSDEIGVISREIDLQSSEIGVQSHEIDPPTPPYIYNNIYNISNTPDNSIALDSSKRKEREENAEIRDIPEGEEKGGVGGRETQPGQSDPAQPSQPAKPAKRKKAASPPKKTAPLENGDVSGKMEVAEYVWLKPAELDRLKAKFGDDEAMRIIEHMSLCKASKGYSYLSDYSAILKWGARAYYEDQTKIAHSQPIRQQERRYDNPHDFFEGGGI